MPLIALVLFIVAAVIFLFAAFKVHTPSVDFTAAGLVILTVAFIAQALITSSIVH